GLTDGIDGVVVVPFVELDYEGTVRHLDRRGGAAKFSLTSSELRILRTETAAILRTLADAKLQFGIGHGPIPILAVGALAREFDIEAGRAMPLARRALSRRLDAHGLGRLRDVLLIKAWTVHRANDTHDDADHKRPEATPAGLSCH